MLSPQPLCLLVDEYLPAPDQRPEGTVPVYSARQLADLLRRFAATEPRIVSVTVAGGPTLTVGVGGDLAAVTVAPYLNSRLDSDPSRLASWTACARAPYAAEHREYLHEGLAYEFGTKTLMPLEEVVQIVLFVVEHHSLPATHEWVGDEGTFEL